MNVRSWYRVELDKSGAILSCQAVDKAEAGGRCVRYVEALSSAEACTVVKAWHARRLQCMKDCKNRLISKRKQAGLCIRCGLPAVPGRTLCDVHRKKHAEQEQKAVRGETRPQIRYTPEQAAVANTQAQRKSFSALGGNAGAYYRRALRHFDKLGPEAFRAWLVAEINRRSAPEKQVK